MHYNEFMTVHVVYASTSGNVEVVVEKVAAVLRQHGLTVTLQRAEKTAVDFFNQEGFFLMATSTWAHGELNPFFAKLHGEMKQAEFSGKTAAFIGLGDKRYEPVLFAQGLEIVRSTWLEKGGAQLGTTLKINGEPYSVLDTAVSAWATELAARLQEGSA